MLPNSRGVLRSSFKQHKSILIVYNTCLVKQCIRLGKINIQVNLKNEGDFCLIKVTYSLMLNSSSLAILLKVEQGEFDKLVE
jgi:hypothetical protein